MDTFQNEEKVILELIFYYLRHSYYLLDADIEYSQNIIEIGDALFNVSLAFEQEFQEIINQEFIHNQNPEQFTASIIPISFNLASSEGLPKDVSIILACSFIMNLIKYINSNHNCFKFIEATKNCITVLIRRKCSYLLENNENRSRFTIFCMMLNAKFESADEDIDKIDVLCSDHDTKERLMQVVDNCCNNIQPILMTDEEAAILATEDVIDYEKENVENPHRVCNWCQQTCEVFVDRALKVYLAISSNKSGDSPRLLRTVTDNIP